MPGSAARGSGEPRGGTEQVHGAAPALLTRIPEGQSHRASKKNFLLLTENKNKVTWRGANNTHTHSIRSPGNYSERPPEHQKIGTGSNNSPGQTESALGKEQTAQRFSKPCSNTHVLEFGHRAAQVSPAGLKKKQLVCLEINTLRHQHRKTSSK